MESVEVKGFNFIDGIVNLWIKNQSAKHKVLESNSPYSFNLSNVKVCCSYKAQKIIQKIYNEKLIYNLAKWQT